MDVDLAPGNVDKIDLIPKVDGNAKRNSWSFARLVFDPNQPQFTLGLDSFMEQWFRQHMSEGKKEPSVTVSMHQRKDGAVIHIILLWSHQKLCLLGLVAECYNPKHDILANRRCVYIQKLETAGKIPKEYHVSSTTSLAMVPRCLH